MKHLLDDPTQVLFTSIKNSRLWEQSIEQRDESLVNHTFLSSCSSTVRYKEGLPHAIS